jgi:putative transposase
MVFPAKYRKVVFGEEVEEELKNIHLEISKRYEIIFLEIGTDENHVHFLIQSVPMYSVKKIVQMVKSITAREMFRRRPEVKEKLWGGEFWSDGYFVGTVGVHGNEETISKYVKKQGIEKKYKKLHQQQLTLPFE